MTTETILAGVQPAGRGPAGDPLPEGPARCGGSPRRGGSHCLTADDGGGGCVGQTLAEPPQERVLRLSRAHPDPGIHRAGTVLGRNDRVEVKFGHLMQIVGETGDPAR
jgi:hypothetical protein